LVAKEFCVISGSEVSLMRTFQALRAQQMMIAVGE